MKHPSRRQLLESNEEEGQQKQKKSNEKVEAAPERLTESKRIQNETVSTRYCCVRWVAGDRSVVVAQGEFVLQGMCPIT